MQQDKNITDNDIEGKSSSKISEEEAGFSYFQVQAYWGATKHMGGFKATQELVGMCGIGSGKYILEVGCGVGMTAWRLAKEYDCYVVGVDLSEDMIDWSRKRAERENVADRTEFRMADVQELPLEDDKFDMVICESVIAFPEDKRRAITECVRVTRPGGYIGLNEGTWLKFPPPIDLVQYIKNTMEEAEFLTQDGWKELLENAGLEEIQAKIFELSMLEQWRNQMGSLSDGDKRDILRAFRGFFSLMVKNPEFRKYARQISPSPGIVRNLLKYLGYGLYAGRKV